MANFEVTIDTKALGIFRKDKLSDAALKALRKAGNDGLKKIRVEGGRYVRERKALGVGFVKRGLRPSRDKNSIRDDLVWRLTVSGAPVPLIEYPHRQLKRNGTKVRVNKGGKFKMIKGAFEARMASGHAGIFRRGTHKRLPIHELFSSTLTDVFKDAGMIPNLFTKANAVMRATYERLLPLELEKLKKTG